MSMPLQSSHESPENRKFSAENWTEISEGFKKLRAQWHGQPVALSTTRNDTAKRESLGTKDAEAAEQIIFAKNQAVKQPALNLHIAKAYLAGSDSGVNTRTWQHAFDAIIATKKGETR